MLQLPGVELPSSSPTPLLGWVDGSLAPSKTHKLSRLPESPFLHHSIERPVRTHPMCVVLVHNYIHDFFSDAKNFFVGVIVLKWE